MKSVSDVNSTSVYSMYFKIHIVVTAFLFLVISYNDTKFDWPMVIFAIMVIFVGTPVEKLIYLTVILGWLYLWVVVFEKYLYRRHLMIIAIGALWIMVISTGYNLFTNEFPDAFNRNHWAIVTSALFLTSSALLVFQMFNTRRQ